MTLISEELMRAVRAGDIELVRSLIETGADVNATDKYGEVVQALLRAGADRAIRDMHGESPHAWGGWHRREKELVDLLRAM